MDRRQRYFREVPEVSRTKPFLFGLLLGAGLSFVALRYHVVRTADGFLLIPRIDQPPVRSAYADIREWGTAMWKQYPELAAALTKDGQGKLVADSITGDLLGLNGSQPNPEDQEPIDILPEDSPKPPTRPASLPRNNPPQPIKVAPTGVERRIAPERPARLSQPASPNQVSAAVPRPAATEESAARVRSALDNLFAPYDGLAGAPADRPQPAAAKGQSPPPTTPAPSSKSGSQNHSGPQGIWS